MTSTSSDSDFFYAYGAGDSQRTGQEWRLSELPRVNVKVIREVTSIVIDLSCRRCKVAFRKTHKSKIKNQRDPSSRKINTLISQTNIAIGRGCIHFTPQTKTRNITTVSLMKAWIKTPEAILKQL